MREELKIKVDTSVSYLKNFEPSTEPYYLCYSGGKDSDCVRILADIAGVNYELHHNHTTVDAPETVYYIREVMSGYGEKTYLTDEKDGHRIVKYGEKGFVHYPLLSMWQLIEKKKMPPTRIVRYCCSELKEKGGKGRRKITGVRWAESSGRKNNRGLVNIWKSKKVQNLVEESGIEHRINKSGGIVLNTDNDESRRIVESCYRTVSTMINPIIDWTDDDVWEFLREYGCESNPLYKQGYKRIGCIGCPMEGGKKQKEEFREYPKYRDAYLSAFEKMIKARKERGLKNYSSFDAESVMRWWVGDDPLQVTMDDYNDMLDEMEVLIDE